MKKRIFSFLLCTAVLLCGCAQRGAGGEGVTDEASLTQVTAPETTAPTGDAFERTDDGRIIAQDGTEYVFLGLGFNVTALGENELIGKIKGEDEFLEHLGGHTPTGMYSCENIPDKRILMRIMPENEWYAYYRRADLPELDLSLDNCVRLELVEEPIYEESIEHMTCGDGITAPDEIKAFLAEIRSGESAKEAGLYESVSDANGNFHNCYSLGRGFGYFKNEPNLAIPFWVTSFNDKAYSIHWGLGDKEYVLPEKWLEKLLKKN